MDKARLMPAVGAGFTLIAQRPVSVMVWGLVYILLSLAPVALLLAANAQELIAGYREMLANPESMAASPPPVFAKLQGLQGLQLLCGLAAFALIDTAIFRAVLRPEQSSFFSLRVGLAELRLAGVAVVLYIFAIFAILALIFVIAIPAIVTAAVSGGDPSPIAIALLILVACAAVIALLPVATRMTMALPMTFAQDRFRLFEAWTLTKGYGWKLTGIFLLLVLITLAVEIVLVIIGVILAAAMTGGFNADRMSTMFSAAGFAEAAPLWTVIGLLYVALVSIVLPITIAPWARAYQLISETTGAAASEAFE